MAIRYSDKPQLQYGTQKYGDDWRNRFPSHAQPIASAPERSASPIWVWEPNGQASLASFYKGNWNKLEPVRDPYSGTTRLRMSGETVTKSYDVD